MSKKEKELNKKVNILQKYEDEKKQNEKIKKDYEEEKIENEEIRIENIELEEELEKKRNINKIQTESDIENIIKKDKAKWELR